MNALLLSAGEATRLRPLSLGTPKCLFPLFGNDPILKYWIDILMSVGIEEVYVNVFWLKHRVIDYLQALNLKNIVWYEQDCLEPVGEVLSKLRNDLGKEFLIVNSDTYIGKQYVRKFVRKAKIDSGKPIYLAVERRRSVRGKGMITFASDQRTVIDFMEKPDIDKPGWVWAGMALMSKDVVCSLLSEGLIYKEISDIFSEFKGRMSALSVDNVYDIGDSLKTYCEAYLYLNRNKRIV